MTPARKQPRSPSGAGLRRIRGVVPVRRMADPNAKLTARELGLALGVSHQLVNRWHTEGYLNRDGQRVYLPLAGRNWRGHRLFRYLDGAKAEAATNRSPKSFRKPKSGAGSWAEMDRNTTARQTTAAR